jgi:hypothetical protein
VLLSSRQLLCTIVTADYAARLRARCSAPPAGLDWHGFTLGATRTGTVSCSGGTLVTGKARIVTLAYGTAWWHGVFTCRSRVTGVTCGTRAGHGLFVSRQTWRAW